MEFLIFYAPGTRLVAATRLLELRVTEKYRSRQFWQDLLRLWPDLQPQLIGDWHLDTGQSLLDQIAAIWSGAVTHTWEPGRHAARDAMRVAHWPPIVAVGVSP